MKLNISPKLFYLTSKWIGIIVNMPFIGSCSSDDTADNFINGSKAIFEPLFACGDGMAGIYPYKPGLGLRN